MSCESALGRFAPRRSTLSCVPCRKPTGKLDLGCERGPKRVSWSAMPLEDLISVCPPPSSPVNAPTMAQWTELETQVGHRLPSDYKAFLARYGSGGLVSREPDGAYFDLLWMLSPGNPPDRRDLNAIPLMMDLNAKTQEMRQRFPQRFPYPVWPDPGGLLVVGGTTTRNDIYWRTHDDEASWTCVLSDTYLDNWFEWAGDLTSLLAAIATRRVPEWFIAGPTKFPLLFLDWDAVDKGRLV